MKTDMKLPPKRKSDAKNGTELAAMLKVLIGREFPLTDKPRTNGSSLRKMIEDILTKEAMATALPEEYQTVTYRKKGIPRLLAQLADSYIVTSGENYNLQVWNRFPNSRNVLIRYDNKERILCKDIRFILVKVNPETKKIDSIVVATPQYIEKEFGKFGVPTMKYQLMISDTKRSSIMKGKEKMLFYPDTEAMYTLTTEVVDLSGKSISSVPSKDELLSLQAIKEKVASKLLGMTLPAKDTKTRGQLLEREVATLLGYASEDTLAGGYPDIAHQLLEVKVQDSPTIDLGKYSPSNPLTVNEEMGVTTEDVRYLIALTDSRTGVIEGLVLSPGASLGEDFTFVNGTSFKCQRSIPMDFFNKLQGQSVFNPKR